MKLKFKIVIFMYNIKLNKVVINVFKKVLCELFILENIMFNNEKSMWYFNWDEVNKDMFYKK